MKQEAPKIHQCEQPLYDWSHECQLLRDSTSEQMGISD